MSSSQPPMGTTNMRKEIASTGISAPSLASTTGGASTPTPKMRELADQERAHPGRAGKSTPSDPGDCDHGHCWGK